MFFVALLKKLEKIETGGEEEKQLLQIHFVNHTETFSLFTVT